MIVVTGGAGFVGSNLVHALNRAGVDDILVVDHFDDGDQFLNLVHARFLDLLDRDSLMSRLPGLGGVRAVFHQGARTATTETDGELLLRNNIDFSKQLMSWCLEHEVPCLHAGSASVYGTGRLGFREEPGCEEPLNAYAFSKWVVDQWLRRQLPRARSQLVSLRYFNVYGPNELHKGNMCSPILHFHRQIETDGRIRLFAGSEGFRRDFVSVDDICALNLWCLEHPEVSGILNAGTGRARSFAEVASIMRRHYDDADVEEVPFPENLAGRYQAFTEADTSALRKAGYDRPFMELEQGIADYVDVLRSNGGRRI